MVRRIFAVILFTLHLSLAVSTILSVLRFPL